MKDGVVHLLIQWWQNRNSSGFHHFVLFVCSSVHLSICLLLTHSVFIASRCRDVGLEFEYESGMGVDTIILQLKSQRLKFAEIGTFPEDEKQVQLWQEQREHKQKEKELRKSPVA